MAKAKYLGLASAAELAIVVTLGADTYAQVAGPSPNLNSLGATEQGATLPPIIVTGYIIPRVGEGPQPVITLDQEFITKQADQTVTDVLQRLPSTVGSIGPTTNSGISSSPAAASVRLHGLPSNSTLVLVDGKRMPSFPFPIAGIISFVDINSIPLAAIDRIEILNDGGSAVYGSDAIAGVVNIITKNEYNGADTMQYWGISEHGDAETYHGSLVGGVSHKLWDDNSKLSIVVAFDYYENGPILAADRPYSANTDYSVLAAKYPAMANNVFSTAGTFNSAQDGSGTQYTVFRGTTPANGLLTSANAGVPRNLNFSPNYWMDLARETRYGGLVNVNLDINQNLKLYDQFLIQRNEETAETPNQGFSSADINGFAPFEIPTTNPFNRTGSSVFISYPGMYLPEMGAWNSDTIVRTIRNVVGLTLQLPHDWVIDANFQYAESDGTEYVYNAINKQRLSQALAGILPGHIGQFFDPFIDERFAGNFNRQFYNALRTIQWEDVRTSVLTWHVSAGGSLFDLCSGPVTVAGGLEYRSEEFIQNQDPDSKFGNVTSPDFSAGHLTTARRWVHSAFFDVEIPLLGNKWSWPGARALQLSIQERYDDYSTFGSAAKPKFAISYKPFNDLTLRASYDEGFAAPSLAEVFTAPMALLAGVNDPLHGGAATSVIIFTGGNQHLKPENSYSYFAGAVWTPGASDPEHSWWGWANGFSAYVDWFSINVRNLIGQLGAQAIVDIDLPGAVIRNGAGTITAVNATFQNVGQARRSGFDFGFTYVTSEYPWGKLDLEFNATYYEHLSLNTVTKRPPPDLPALEVQDRTDSYGIPDFKSVGSVFYSKTVFGVDTLRTGVTVNFVDSEHDIADNFKGTNPLATLDAPGYVHRIGDWTTFDWQISYGFGAPAEIVPETPKPGYDKAGKRIVGERAIAPKPEGTNLAWRWWLANTTFTFGINNVFNTRPPLSVDGYQGFDTTNANPYGRFYYLQFEKKF
jgi:iron complex outermembrane recepter protein